jgi:hypothetical protein
MADIINDLHYPDILLALEKIILENRKQTALLIVLAQQWGCLVPSQIYESDQGTGERHA